VRLEDLMGLRPATIAMAATWCPAASISTCSRGVTTVHVIGPW